MTSLSVAIDDTLVGHLVASHGDRTTWVPDADWANNSRRKVLGQHFQDYPDRAIVRHVRIPEWFSNLLPEGALRARLADSINVKTSREFELLRRVGSDLPGAVVVTDAEMDPDWAGGVDDNATQPAGALQPFSVKHSLAGVQLKLSVLAHDRKITVPASGAGGGYLLKFASEAFPDAAHVERATMAWAKMAGLDVPECWVVPLSDIDGLPDSFRKSVPSADCYVIRRFDRAESGHRVHQEDFCQILNYYPEDKYLGAYETIGRILLAQFGLDTVLNFVARLAFMFAVGNGDAHHKNWSIQYGQTPGLSPNYDLVSTVAWSGLDYETALLFGRCRSFAEISQSHVSRFARAIAPDRASLLTDTFYQSLCKSLSSWEQARAEAPKNMVLGVARHHKASPLIRSMRLTC